MTEEKKEEEKHIARTAFEIQITKWKGRESPRRREEEERRKVKIKLWNKLIRCKISET